MTMRARRGKIAAIVTSLTVGGWLVLTACSNNAEGERCQVNNNDDDCENGLICLPASQVNQSYNGSDRCCPIDRSTATHPACTLLQNPVAGDSAPPADTGPVTPDTGTSDTGATDTGVDTGVDASDTDAADAADAAADG
jgi:hypothetical protein